MGMETKIPRRKPSKLFIAALSLSVAAHLALFVAIQLTPKRENDLKKSYDYISSAVWEVFGPTSVIKVIEFNWPTGLEGEERPSCVDIESALVLLIETGGKFWNGCRLGEPGRYVRI